MERITAFTDCNSESIVISERRRGMSDYRCKVRIIRDREITIYAKNKNEAEEKAKNLCEIGVGLPLEVHMEVLEIERMTAKKKAQERESNNVTKQKY